VVVYNSNPAAIAPHQRRVLEGLRRDDLFTVVLEQFQTDTADYADVLLPVTTFLEHTDIYTAYGHYHLQLARPALPRPGEVKSNVEIFRLLAERLNFDDPCFGETEDEMISALLDSSSRFVEGITLKELDAKLSVHLRTGNESEPFLPFARGGFRTRSGRFEFGADSLGYTPPIESRHGDRDLLRRFPLELISSKNDDSMNSTFGHRSDVDAQTAVLMVHPDDAECRGIVDGMLVRAHNDRGSCFFAAKVSSDVAPGVVRAGSVRRNKKSPAHLGVNQLTSDRLTDLGGATFYSCLVEVTGTEQVLGV